MRMIIRIYYLIPVNGGIQLRFETFGNNFLLTTRSIIVNLSFGDFIVK